MPAAGEAGAMAAGAGNYIAGILLVLPGFAGDLIGLLLLLPPVRRGILAKMAANMTNAAAARGGVRMSMRMQTGPRPGAPGDIIDGEATEITPEATALPGRDPAGRRPSGWQQGPDLRD